MRLKGKVALITGAASGIGLETSKLFIKEGAIVAACDYNEESLQRMKSEIGDSYRIYKMDVSKHDDVKTIVDKIFSDLGHIDILVNNAGITKDNFLVKMPESDFDAVISVNLKGVYNVTQAVVPYMMNQRSGVILNASSVVGIYGNIGQTNYAAAKAGLIGMTKTWAKEFARYNIRANAIAPGFIKTPMTEKVPEKIIDQMKAKTPLGRMGEAIDVANAYLFLASDEANYITGQVLGVDGGLVF
ncbi:3-oxoacyl-[acyl-carrier-protein] reductase [Athalassotoga saccharophila]|uniref:3-oxoacyl-[acyl-carrier-protein] reductase n=1 Tax=Athalassotoga saccharophila TaxID=1441386 RepID=UPI00137B4ECD|nr:3-oxoacyl-[acyl-carrier-protein] reductase [Athalassotoga saccharophila]BBJ28112.1 3-oxoacyl-[acyl-carrier-protein] reductase FabG [Athalassotoga saccharophila]